MTRKPIRQGSESASQRLGPALVLALLCVASQQAGAAYLFREDFEKPGGASTSSYLSGRGWYDLSSNPTIVTSEHFSGNNGLAYTISNGETSNGGMRLQLPNLKTVYLQYARKYPTNFLWPTVDNGPHDFYIWANASQFQAPTEVPFSFYVEQSGRTVNGVRRNGIAHLETKNAAGQYTGYDDPSLTPVFTLGTWHVVDAMITMNDPGQSNGEFSMSVDGVQRIKRTGLRFNSGSGSMLFNQLFFGPYFHEGARQTQTFWTDNIIISDAPIGATPAPIPASLLLLGSGVLGVSARLRRRKARTDSPAA